MGQIKTKIIITNYADIANKTDNPRQIETEAVVDSGARMLSISEYLAQTLGLEIVDKKTVKYADGKTVIKNIDSVVHVFVSALKRNTNCNVMIESPGAPILLGQIPMEDMDVVIDMSNETLTVNPESPFMPMSHQFSR